MASLILGGGAGGSTGMSEGVASSASASPAAGAVVASAGGDWARAPVLVSKATAATPAVRNSFVFNMPVSLCSGTKKRRPDEGATSFRTPLSASNATDWRRVRSAARSRALRNVVVPLARPDQAAGRPISQLRNANTGVCGLLISQLHNRRAPNRRPTLTFQAT